MPRLYQALDANNSATILYTWPLTITEYDGGQERRSGAIDVPGLDGALSSYGTLPGPLKKRDFTFGWVVEPKRDVDTAIQTAAKAFVPGRQLRLVRITDSGLLHYNLATVLRFDAPVNARSPYETVPLKATFELLDPIWREFFPVNVLVVGAGGYVVGQNAPTITVGAQLTVTLGSTTPTWNIDASAAGTGGVPTFDDTGPAITITGPFGGDGGFTFYNNTALVGNASSWFSLALKLASGDYAVIDAGAQSVYTNVGGVGAYREDLLTWQAGQPYWMAIKAGVVNAMSMACIGANATSGGKAVVTWFRKFAA